MKTTLNEQIHSAESKAAVQNQKNTPIFLFEEDRSGTRMGKPGDAKNPYHARWFEFYTLDAEGTPKHEKTSIRFMENDRPVEVSGGNGISEVDAIEAFRKAHPNQAVIMLSIEPSKKLLSDRISDALSKYEKDKEALLSLPPYEKSKQAEPTL